MASATEKVGRWHVASRVFAATIPGFVITNAAAILLSFLLPGDKISGVANGMIMSWAIWTAIIIWIFSVRRLRTVWLGLLAMAVVSCGGVALAIFMGAAA